MMFAIYVNNLYGMPSLQNFNCFKNEIDPWWTADQDDLELFCKKSSVEYSLVYVSGDSFSYCSSFFPCFI
jgi:hypothetical protein